MYKTSHTVSAFPCTQPLTSASQKRAGLLEAHTVSHGGSHACLREPKPCVTGNHAVDVRAQICSVFGTGWRSGVLGRLTCVQGTRTSPT
jgi:hypothetical protein